MFERMLDRARALAEARAAARRRATAQALKAALPRGIAVEATDGGVTLSGRGLARRAALDARLRALVEGLVR